VFFVFWLAEKGDVAVDRLHRRAARRPCKTRFDEKFDTPNQLSALQAPAVATFSREISYWQESAQLQHEPTADPNVDKTIVTERSVRNQYGRLFPGALGFSSLTKS
jgi:hypothetical protein